MGSITNVLGERLVYSMPEFREGSITDIMGEPSPGAYDWVILAVSQFTIEDLRVVGNILMIFEIGALDRLFEKIGAVTGTSP